MRLLTARLFASLQCVCVSEEHWRAILIQLYQSEGVQLPPDCLQHVCLAH
jgi:hypothetical protein